MAAEATPGTQEPLADAASRVAAARRLARALAEPRVLTCLGHGQEGVVLCDGRRVFKVFDGWQAREEAEIEAIVACNLRLLRASPAPSWCPRDATLDRCGSAGTYVLGYGHEPSEPYAGGHEPEVVQLVRGLRALGLMYYGFRPSSFRVAREGLRLVDLGCDLRPLDPGAVRHNLERAFLMVRLGAHPALRALQERARQGLALPELEGFEPFARRCLEG